MTNYQYYAIIEGWDTGDRKVVTGLIATSVKDAIDQLQRFHDLDNSYELVQIGKI